MIPSSVVDGSCDYFSFGFYDSQAKRVLMGDPVSPPFTLLLYYPHGKCFLGKKFEFSPASRFQRISG